MTSHFSKTNGTPISTSLYGRSLLADSFFNKGTAFTEDERKEFELTGLLPAHVSTLEEQLQQTYENFKKKETPLEKYLYLAALQDCNETLFYRLVQTHIAEMVPIIYTPTVGEACQKFSHIFSRALGLYLSYPNPRPILDLLKANAPEDMEVIVVTDGERILGLGDLGVGGMGIPIGKLALYSLCAGLHPRKTLPILLDVGTNNTDLLNDPLYLGWRHQRLQGEDYDRYIDSFVQAVKTRWPHVILQWEDFSKNNAWRLLQHYRSQLATFNDDIQGTAAVTLAGLLRAVQKTGRDLAEERIVIAGAGSAATGIADLICAALQERGKRRDQTLRQLWLVDSRGLVHIARSDLSVEKRGFAQTLDHLKQVGLDAARPLSLETVVRQVKPTALIGVSGQPGMFTEPLIRLMTAAVPQPIIFPLSNPTSKAEATPQQLTEWTNGQALVATGSPFPPMTWQDRQTPVGQCNNAFIFPGIGLGLVASQAASVPEEVFLASAKTLAAFNERLPGYADSLFPNLEHVKTVSCQIALAVGQEIIRKGLSYGHLKEEQLPERLQQCFWEPGYRPLRRLPR
ncbi:MAG: NAD-dependent malic enzyme [Elusimicrobiota bacterium]|jgi:malate dehydrogenase (oxaloacetate-decarboxylating)